MAISTQHMRVLKSPGTLLEELWPIKAPRVVKLLAARSRVLLGHKVLWIVVLLVSQPLRLQSLISRLYSLNHNRLESWLLARNVSVGREGGHVGWLLHKQFPRPPAGEFAVWAIAGQMETLVHQTSSQWRYLLMGVLTPLCLLKKTHF